MGLRHHGIETRTFGVEIEVSGLTISAAVTALEAAGLVAHHGGTVSTQAWSVVHDGSVTPPGCEARSPILFGEAGIEQVVRAADALRAAGARINQSTGLHVHVGARDLSINQLRNVVKMFLKYEDVFDTLVSQSRRSNHFCRSLLGYFGRLETEDGQVNACESAFSALDACASIDALIRLFGTRYLKLNLESYWRHGTVEFRLHQGSVRSSVISHWIRFVVSFVNAAAARRTVKPRVANGQSARYRFKWLFNDVTQGEVRRFQSHRAAVLRRLDRAAVQRAARNRERLATARRDRTEAAQQAATAARAMAARAVIGVSRMRMAQATDTAQDVIGVSRTAQATDF